MLRWSPLLAISFALAVSSLTPRTHARSIDKSPRQTHILKSGSQFLALESWDRIGLYDIESGKKTRTFSVPSPYIEDYALSGNEKTLAIVGRNGLWIFEFRTAIEITHIPSDVYSYGIAIDAAGAIVATAAYKSGNVYVYSVYIYSLPTGRLIANVDAGPEPVVGLALSPDGTSCAFSALDERVYLFEVATGALTETKVSGGGFIHFSSDGKRLAMRSNNSGSAESLRILDVGSYEVKDLGSFRTISKLRATEDGFILVAQSKETQYGVEGHFLLNESTTLQSVWTHSSRLLDGADFLPNGRKAVKTDFSVETTVVDFKTGSTVFSFQGTYGAVDYDSPTVYYLLLGIGAALLGVAVVAVRIRKCRKARVNS